jgi:hypothetical protein
MQKTKEQNEPHWKTGGELRYWNRVEHHNTQINTNTINKTWTIIMKHYGHLILRRVLRYKRSNQNPYIEEEQSTQWPKGQTTIYKTYILN